MVMVSLPLAFRVKPNIIEAEPPLLRAGKADAGMGVFLCGRHDQCLFDAQPDIGQFAPALASSNGPLLHTQNWQIPVLQRCAPPVQRFVHLGFGASGCTG